MTQYYEEKLLDVLKSIDKSLMKISSALAYSPDTKIMSVSESNVLINDKLEELNSIVNDLSEKIEWNSYGKTNYCMNCGAKMENAEI